MQGDDSGGGGLWSSGAAGTATQEHRVGSAIHRAGNGLPLLLLHRCYCPGRANNISGTSPMCSTAGRGAQTATNATTEQHRDREIAQVGLPEQPHQSGDPQRG